ncbi:MAG: ATP-binding protein, partial [Pseudomonadota bacterium]
AGMNEEQLTRAVEPFYTTKPEQGNGLGLSMVYGFSKQLGGDLEIDSVRGEGTVVRVILPLANTALHQQPVIELAG